MGAAAPPRPARAGAGAAGGRLAGDYAFDGLQGYEGHCVDLRDEPERAEKTRASLKLLVETRACWNPPGPVRIVSGGRNGDLYDHGKL